MTRTIVTATKDIRHASGHLSSKTARESGERRDLADVIAACGTLELERLPVDSERGLRVEVPASFSAYSKYLEDRHGS